MSKILVIEDEDALREMYTKMLTDEQFTADSAPDGEQGMKKVIDFNPDLILLDLIMPKMNGFQVLQQLKGNEVTKNIKVVVLTNIYADQQELIQQGADRVLMKTDYNPGQIVQIVKDTLQK